MPRQVDLMGVQVKGLAELTSPLNHYNFAVDQQLDYKLVRWIAAMCCVQFCSAWERYAERRLIVALNHNPQHFLKENAVRGLKHIPVGLATVLVRGGNRYFDFRSMEELMKKANYLVGEPHNPFKNVPRQARPYLDALAAIRNCIVHRSDASVATYKRTVRKVYGIKATPEPDEFLNAKETRKGNPMRGISRIQGLSLWVFQSISKT